MKVLREQLIQVGLAVSIKAPTRAYVNSLFLLTASWPDTTPGGRYGVFINWNDGTTSQWIEEVPFTSWYKKYTSPKTYNITVTITDLSTGLIVEGTHVIGVASLLTASLSADKTSVQVNEIVTFTIGFTGGFSPHLWSLDFGDGSQQASGSNPSVEKHQYGSPGTYTAVLTVEDALGIETELRINIYR